MSPPPWGKSGGDITKIGGDTPIFFARAARAHITPRCVPPNLKMPPAPLVYTDTAKYTITIQQNKSQNLQQINFYISRSLDERVHTMMTLASSDLEIDLLKILTFNSNREAVA